MKLLTFKTVLNFGRYKGKTIGDVYDLNASYLQWAMKDIKWFKLSKKETNMIIEEAMYEEQEINSAIDEAFGWGYDCYGGD